MHYVVNAGQHMFECSGRKMLVFAVELGATEPAAAQSASSAFASWIRDDVVRATNEFENAESQHMWQPNVMLMDRKLEIVNVQAGFNNIALCDVAERLPVTTTEPRQEVLGLKQTSMGAVRPEESLSAAQATFRKLIGKQKVKEKGSRMLINRQHTTATSTSLLHGQEESLVSNMLSNQRMVPKILCSRKVGPNRKRCYHASSHTKIILSKDQLGGRNLLNSRVRTMRLVTKTARKGSEGRFVRPSENSERSTRMTQSLSKKSPLYS